MPCSRRLPDIVPFGLAAAVVLGAAAGAQAATVVWGGGDGTFATAANWVGGSAPASGDTVSFGGWAPLDRTGWTASTSLNTGTPSNALDGRPSTLWSSGTSQAVNQTFAVNMGSAQTFRQIVMESTTNANEYARGFWVYASNNGSTWTLIGSGAGSSATVTVNVSPAIAYQYIQIRLNAVSSFNWSIGEFTVYGTAGVTELSRNGWTASASGSGSGTPASNAIDSGIGTRWNPGTTQTSGQWFSVDMGAAQTFTRIDMDAYYGTTSGEYPRGYDVYVSSDGTNWGSVIASATPSSERTSITFSSQTERYIKIQLNTTTSSNSWSLVDFKVYGTPANCNLAANVSVAGLSLDESITVTQGSGVTLTVSGTYAQSAGTFTGGDSAISVGNFSLTGGTFSNTTDTLTASGTFATGSGTTFTNTSGDVSCSSTASAATIGGSYTVGTGTHTFSGGLNVSGTATLTMAASGTLALGSGTTLAMDGTLVASDAGAAIASAGGAGTSYTFKVGSTATATPTLNITGLKVRNTDTNGMWINANTSASATFTRFDGIAFSSGTGNYLLQIYSKSLYLTSSGCTFDAGGSASTTYNVGLTGNGISDGETRAVFGGATCASNVTSCQSAKSDDDADNDGVGSNTGTNGAVVQFVSTAQTDMAGTLVGFPTAAFDWDTFSYYATYVAYNSASGTKPVLYVRDSSGNAKYAWTGSDGETMVGTPRWITSGSTHYVYVAMSSGKVYRLVDDGSSSLALDTSWTTNPYDCSCTIVTPLTTDTSNLYWGGTQSGAQKLWTLGQTTESQPMGSPLSVTPTITSASPLLWTNAGTTYLFLGTTGHLLEVNISNQTLAADNSNPGSASIWGRIDMGTNTTHRVLAGDDGGTFWSIDPTLFSGTNKQWSYVVSGDAIKSSSYYDHGTDTVMFGTEGGQIVALTAAGAAMTGYPYLPGSSSDAIRSAPLFCDGVLAVGTTTGKLFFLDRNNGSTGPALIRQYAFGSTESVSGIAVDPSSSRYMVTTSDSTAKDGRLYYFDFISDPTPASL